MRVYIIIYKNKINKFSYLTDKMHYAYKLHFFNVNILFLIKYLQLL